MGEVVVSSGEELEVKTGSETEEEKQRKQCKEETESETGEVKRKRTRRRRRKESEDSNNGLVRWERFLPRIVLRVLLVEADDSTRQIIAALLTKCSYKVDTVADGLKAWEILKERPHNIDLILTEVDLPSVSGYALLTLIMEHEICKNIPVIMMSSQDSIKAVYKCMLRGAADYLVKPIRKNELRNLWQHVWRKQSSLGGGNGPRDESGGLDKIETTFENNAADNHSSGATASIQRSKEQAEKGSDSQSSCTKPGLEAEGAYMENKQEFLQPVWSKFSFTDTNMQKHEEHVNLGQKLLVRDSEAEGSTTAACEDSNKIMVDKEITPGSGIMTANIAIEGCDKIGALANSPREAIDFMGASMNHSYSFNNVEIHFGSSQHLDLSLRRSHPRGFEIPVTEERHILRHSNASAFTRYINRALKLPLSSPANTGNQKELRTNYDAKISSNVNNGYNSDALSLAPSARRSAISLAAGQTREYEIVTSSSGEKVFPTQIPVKDTRFNNLCNSYGAVLPPIFCKQSDLSPMMSQSSARQKEPIHKVNPFQCSNYGSTSEHHCDRFGQNANDSINGSLQKQENKLDSLEGREHISSATDQSASSSFCNGAATHFNSIGYGSTSGSYSNADQVATVTAASESKNEGVFTHKTNSHRSIHREAALNKFRLKRKERCYEKKVRYESRKKLAEQRPRVKGQFVRQVHIDPSPAKTDQ